MTKNKLSIADLFCGAGGSSTGAVEAAQILGLHPSLTVVNHWDRAIDTHKLNHPSARHFCTGVDNINPREIFAEDELDVLLASPECTHFSTARGGRPVNEQSRATAMCVIRWAEALRPPIMIIENVPEFRSWGPVIKRRVKGETAELVPDPKRKGELFEAWLQMLRAIGYKVDHRIICCANFGDPTTRRRLFIQCVRGKRKIVWPNATHLEDPSAELSLSKTREWATARNSVIDWTLEGKSIYERKKPLSPKTMARIMAGLEKFGLKPFIVPQMTCGAPRGLHRPIPSVTTTSRGVKLIEPYLVNMKGKSNAASIDKPTPTVTAHAQHMMLAQPFIIGAGGPTGQANPQTVDDPLGSVLAHDRRALVNPCLIKLRGTNDAADVDKPAPTVCGSGGHIGLAEFIIQNDQTGSNGHCSKSVDRPLGTVVSKQNSALVSPYLVQLSHGDGKDANAKLRRVASVDSPHPTVCGNRGDFALCEPHLLPQQSGGILRSIDEPAPTVATDGAIGVVEPYLIKFYGTAKTASVDDPLDTVTAKDRFGLVRPVIEVNGQQYILDIRFRMLQPHELAAAQGFKADYQFLGNKTEIVKMIGNAVPRRTIRALVLAAVSQDSDVAFLIDKEEEAA